MYEIFAKASYRAINMRCYCESDEMLLRKRRNVVAKAMKCYCENDEMLLRKRQDVNKFVVTCHHLKTSFLFKYEVRRYIRSLVQENNCEIENFDVLEIYN